MEYAKQNAPCSHNMRKNDKNSVIAKQYSEISKLISLKKEAA